MTPEPAQKCGAMMPALKDFGWECSGTGLIVVMRIRQGTLPVVLPRRALEIIDPESWWDDPVASFTGGDHAHLVVSRRPDAYQKTDGVLVMSRAAYPVIKIGFQLLGGDADDPFRQ